MKFLSLQDQKRALILIREEKLESYQREKAIYLAKLNNVDLPFKSERRLIQDLSKLLKAIESDITAIDLNIDSIKIKCPDKNFTADDIPF